MEGYLSQWINIIYRWKLRYFILHNGILVYCEKKDGAKKGSIHLQISSIILIPNDPLRIIINSGTKEIHLRAKTISEKIKWVSALRNQQEESFNHSSKRSMSSRSQLFPQLSPRNKVQEMLTDVWTNQAKFDEAMAELSNEKIPLHLSQKLQHLSDIGSNLKKAVTLAAKYMSEEMGESRSRNGTLFLNQETARNQNLEEFDQDFDLSDCVSMNSERQISARDYPTNGLIPNNILNIIKNSDPVKFVYLFTQRILTSNPVFQEFEIGNQREREALPVPKDPKEKVNIWLLLKELIGKDLSKFSVPVHINEPLSMLQRLADQLEYWDLLNVANNQEDSLIRMAFVMAFGVSSYSFPKERCYKPFNPLLGETFEFIDEEIGAKFISEQVSHHPPISAGFAESENFSLWMNSRVKTKFWGNSLEASPLGLIHVILKRFKDHFTFSRCKSVVNNIIMGQFYVEHRGVMTFKNLSTNETAEVNLLQRGWTGKFNYEMKGAIKDSNGDVKYSIAGCYNKSFVITHVVTGKEIKIWEVVPYPANSEWNYFYTKFSMQLNHITLDQLPFLPPTDSRLRPDQRAIELRLMELASNEKNRLEVKQREKRREMESRKEKHVPLWFHEKKGDHNEETEWEYNGGYWEARNSKNFSKFPDIF